MGGKPGNGRPKTVRIGWVGSDGIGRIPLTHGAVAIVDAEDVERLSPWAWYLDGNGYGKTAMKLGHNNFKGVSMHRFIMGVQDPKQFIDHISRDRLDNRKMNLRLVDNATNARNSPAKRTKQQTSQYRGVHKRKISQVTPWCAQVYFNGVKKGLGYFATEIEAARAYDTFIKQHCDKHAYVNFPD